MKILPAKRLEKTRRGISPHPENSSINNLKKIHTMTESGSNALKNLVIFIAALAVFGTILALMWYFAIDLPVQQAALHAPANAWPYTGGGGIGTP
jgi:hypothetical protein